MPATPRREWPASCKPGRDAGPDGRHRRSVGARQAELAQSVGQRLDAMTGRLGQTMTEQTKSTHESLAKLQERLAVVDLARGNIQSLARPGRSASGEPLQQPDARRLRPARIEAVAPRACRTAPTKSRRLLSRGSRPDCLVKMPNGAPALAVDAKFPPQAWNPHPCGAEEAVSFAEGPQHKRFGAISRSSPSDISEKYLIQGETQDTAFMFVPSESMFAENNENFEGIVHKAHRTHIVIVSPSLLILSIQVIQAILKDAPCASRRI